MRPALLNQTLFERLFVVEDEVTGAVPTETGRAVLELDGRDRLARDATNGDSLPC